MRSHQLSIALLVVAACGHGPRTAHPHSFTEHLASAQQHERNAEQHARAASRAEASPRNYTCGDPVLNDQLTTGGQQVTEWQPCWEIEGQAAVDQRAQAERERRLANRDRRIAARLLEAEVASCQGIPERDVSTSPFDHRKAIAEVIPHREGGSVRGVRVMFKKIPGLTVSWMQRSIACHRARFAAFGKPPTYLPEDPTLVDDAQVTVSDRGDSIEVLVTTDSADAAAAVVARAEGLVTPQTARR